MTRKVSTISTSPNSANLRNILLRGVSAIVGMPLVLASIWAGGAWFLTATLLVSLGASWEYRRLGRAVNASPLLIPALLINPGLISVAYFQPVYFVATIALISLGILILHLAFRTTDTSFHDFAFTISSVVYIGLPLALGILLRNGEQGPGWVLLAIAAAFASDIAAYGIGRIFGSHPLAPTISRGKTWEGAVGGMVAAIAITLFLSSMLSLPLASLSALGLGILLGISAQLGDLTESSLKRAAALKDASQLIPGHGGVLDRLDSVAFNLIIVYCAALWSIS